MLMAATKKVVILQKISKILMSSFFAQCHLHSHFTGHTIRLYAELVSLDVTIRACRSVCYAMAKRIAMTVSMRKIVMRLRAFIKLDFCFRISER